MMLEQKLMDDILQGLYTRNLDGMHKVRSATKQAMIIIISKRSIWAACRKYMSAISAIGI